MKIMILNKHYKEEFSESTSKFLIKNNNRRSKKGLFLDRDGVLIKDVHYNNTGHNLAAKMLVEYLKGDSLIKSTYYPFK